VRKTSAYPCETILCPHDMTPHTLYRSRGGRMRSAGILLVALLVVVGCGGGARVGARAGAEAVAVKMQRFVSAASDAADYENIWGRLPSAGQLTRSRQALNEALGAGLTQIRATGGSTDAQQFVAAYRSSSSDVITLVGHNEGSAFRFPDGSAVDLRGIGLQRGPVLALVSCNSATYANGQSVGLPTAVTLELAFDVEQRFAAKVQGLALAPTPADAQLLLVGALNEAGAQRTETFKYVAIGGGVAGGSVVGVAIWQVQ
jgi:hypothetical protein